MFVLFAVLVLACLLAMTLHSAGTTIARGMARKVRGARQGNRRGYAAHQ